jgi:ubiquinone/menaquinone biosynthesis C-methylase UbiE
MGFYGERILPRIVNRLMDTKHTREVRARVCGDLAGDVVEIGFGSGLNLPHLPPTVSSVRAVEPALLGRRLAEERIEAAGVRVEFSGLDGQRLPFESGSVPVVLSTWTLCTIPDAPAALAEIKRVLVPGGRFHFVEHGLSPDANVAKWQHRLNPLQRKLAGGCNLDRDIPGILEEAGFAVERLDTYYLPGSPKAFDWTFEGVASPA